ncbi:MAG: hypothetical protein ACD_54C00983G0003 [uncultured bacterium]|nr:MAG: hypothetical protein ACD_54C00983G0003 [uncultured bacterium]
MTLKARLMMFTAAVTFSATMASAAITANDVVATYQSQGYTYVQVKDGISQIKVEAIKDGVKLEVIYDKASGNVISQETRAVQGSEAGLSGVEVQHSNGDFDDTGDDDNGDDDNGDDDNGDDDNGGDDTGDDDNDGDDNGSDDNGDDDNGSDGSGHDADDDHGSDDDSGSDDNGGSDDGGDDSN